MTHHHPVGETRERREELTKLVPVRRGGARNSEASLYKVRGGTIEQSYEPCHR